MHKHLFILTLSTIIAGSAFASETLHLNNNNSNLSLSIYNNNLALIKDIRPAEIKSGTVEVIFDGVAQKMLPETAIILGHGIKVLEQNYSYNLMSNANLLQQSVGQEVMTVRENPQNGENIFEKATLISTVYGNPILKFSYGIEANFKGRILFNHLPENISNKPIFTAQLQNKKAGNKNLYLAYLTSGLNWKTDYVANINSDSQLDLTAWVTINNESGIDFNNAKIQLIAGNVNSPVNVPSPKLMMLANSAREIIERDTANVSPQNLEGYELYTLPNITSIKDKQNKQISLFEKQNVTYQKELNLTSLLYFGANNDFEKVHPEITYILNNIKQSNLGISLPAGTIRFYKNDKNGNMQFIGADNIYNTAKNKKARLNLGSAFNLTANGKIIDVKEKELEKTPYKSCFNVKMLKTYSVKIDISNADNAENTVIVKQHFPENYKIVKESIKSLKPNSTTRKWAVKVPANETSTLSFDVEITQNNRNCD